MKGQTTIFVIIGIVLLLAFGLIFILPEESDFQEVETTDAEVIVESCLRNSALDGLRLMGRQGNRINIPNILEKDDTSLWIYEYGNVMPVFNSTVDEYERFVETQFLRCIDFSNLGYNVDAGMPSTEAEFSAEEVLIRLDYPVNLTKGGEFKQIKGFQQTLNVRYRRMFERAKNIVEAHYLPFFDYENALALVDQRDFNISYEILDENNLVFTIRDEKFLEGQEFEMKFATNLNRSYLKRTLKVDSDSLNFFLPYTVYSPDRMAQLILQRGVHVNAEELYVYQDYPANGTREVVTDLSYLTKGASKRLLGREKDDITWKLTYPVYEFGPDGTEFKTPDGQLWPQQFAIFWDDDKNPNSGPMGMLYKGPRSDYEWRPVRVGVDYENSFVATNMQGFSSYTALDCNAQSCKSATVRNTNQPAKATMCGILNVLKVVVAIIGAILLIIGIGAIVLGLLSGFGSIGPLVSFYKAVAGVIEAAYTVVSAFFTTGALTTGVTVSVAWTNALLVVFYGTLITGALYGIGEGLGWGDYDENAVSSINILPTCDQVVEVVCTGDSHLEKGHGMLGSKILSLGTNEVTVNGGQAYALTAIATKCDKGSAKCYDCQFTCTVYYK